MEVDHHVFGRGAVEVHADGVEVAPTVAVLRLHNHVVGVARVDGLVLEALVAGVGGAHEAQTVGVLDVHVVDDGSGRTHRDVGDVIVFESSRAAIDGVARKVEAFDPNAHLADRVAAKVGFVVVLCDVRGVWRATVAVEGHHRVLLGIGFAVTVGVVLVLHPEVHRHRVRRRRQVLRNETHLLGCGWNHPGVVVHATPILRQVGSAQEDRHREEVGLVGVNREVERHRTILVRSQFSTRTQRVAAFVADHADAKDLVSSSAQAKVDGPRDVPTNRSADVVDFGPSNGDVAVDVVHGLLLQHEVVGRGVWGDIEVLQTDAHVDGHVSGGDRCVEVLNLRVGVEHLQAGDAGIVLDGVSFAWVKEDGSRQAVNAVGTDAERIQAQGFRVFPSRVDAEPPRDVLARRAGGVHHGGRFQGQVIARVSTLLKAGHFRPRHFDRPGGGLEQQHGLCEGGSGCAIDRVGAGHLVDVT